VADQRLQLCIDRVVPDEYNPARAAAAQGFAERLMSLDPNAVMRPKMAIPVSKMWPNGTELRCRFLDGSAKQRRKVEAKAHEWERYANITLKFVTTTDEQIRISFSADAGSWSALGTDALITTYFPRYAPTMNYGWLEDDTDDEEYGRVVRHEFGHALGCIHEHQNPNVKLKWNRAEVYRAYSGPPNYWDRDEIDHNILRRYSKTQMNATAFDADSIMLYYFPPELFTDGRGTSKNTTLSTMDKTFIGRMYPKGS
jgi:hypothetical protein